MFYCIDVSVLKNFFLTITYYYYYYFATVDAS